MERDAFISYSQRRDRGLARALEKGLRDLRRTAWLRRPGAKVFLDSASLAANSDLGGAIKNALLGSRYLIYLASPEAARSRWVREELAFWRANRPMDNVLIALSGGTIVWDETAGDFDWQETTAVPDVLRGAFAAEPLWVDLRHFRDVPDLRTGPGSAFRDRVVTLAAPLHGLDKDALDSEDLQLQSKAARFRNALVAGLSLMLVLAITAGVVAWQQRGEAITQRNEARERARISASQALSARALEMASTDPRKAAQFALYARAVKPTGESAQALARAMAANADVARHFQPGSEQVVPGGPADHPQPTTVAVSPDGSVMAYYSAFDRTTDLNAAGRIHLYDIRAGRELPSIDGVALPQAGGVLAFTADGRTLAVETLGRRIELWNVRQRQATRKIELGRDEQLAEDTASQGIVNFALSDDGSRLAGTVLTADDDTPRTHHLVLTVWETGSGRRLSRMPVNPASTGLAFDRDQRLVLLDAAAHTVRSLPRESETWSEPRTIPDLPAHDGNIVLSPDGTRVLYGPRRSGNGPSEVRDLTTGRQVAANATTIALPTFMGGTDGTILAADDHHVVVYDANLHAQRTLGSFSWPVLSLAASRDGNWVAATSSDGEVSLFKTDAVPTSTTVTNEHEVKASELMRDKRLTVRSDGSGTDLWNVTGSAITPLGHIPTGLRTDARDTMVADPAGHRAVVNHVAIDNVDNVVHTQGSLSLWDPHTGLQLGTDPSDTAKLQPLALLPNDTDLLASTDSTLEVIDTGTWQVRQSLPFDRGTLDGLAVSADRKTLATTGIDGLTVWRWTPDRRVTRVGAIPMIVGLNNGIAVSNHGEKVAAIDGDHRITVLDIASGRTVKNSSVSQNGPMAIAFSEDAALVVQPVTTGRDVTLQFWDSESGEARGSWAVPGMDAPASIDASAPQLNVLNSSDDGAVVVAGGTTFVRYVVDVEAWHRILCGIVPDPLSPEDYDRYLKGLVVAPPCRS